MSFGDTLKTAGKVVGLGALTAAAPMVGVPVLAGMAAKSAKNREYDPVRQQKDMLMEDLKRMREDPGSLGMSEAERTKMIGDATSAANAQQQGQVSQLGQQALAGQGFQAGAFQEAQRGIAGQSGDAAVKAAVGVNDLNQRMIQQESDRIRGELDAARERTRENTRFWSQFAISGVGALIGAAMNPAGALGGLMGGAGSAPPPVSTTPPPQSFAAPTNPYDLGAGMSYGG